MLGNRVFVLVVLQFIALNVYATDFYSFSVKDHDGEVVSLEKYRGKVTLVVNVASHCGFTEVSYHALTKIHDILSYGGFFSVLAFPCNQFGEQEPDEASVVAARAVELYSAEFPIMDKIDVLGEHAAPAFRNLIEQSSKEPEWNFYKYLVGADGVVLGAWGTKTEMEDIFPEVQVAVDVAKALAAAAEKTAAATPAAASERPSSEETLEPTTPMPPQQKKEL